MKSVIFVTVFAVSASSIPLMGNYKAIIESIDDRKDMDRTYADWRTMVEKRSKKESGFAGNFEVKKTLEQPQVKWDTFIWSETRGWNNFKMAMLNKLSLCDEKIKKKYYDPYFKGNATWVFPDCIITTGHMEISKDNKINIDQVMHAMMDQCVYGRFKFETKILIKDEVVFGGLDMIVRIEPTNETRKRS